CLGGGGRPARRAHCGAARWRVAGAAVERADPPRPRRDGAVDGAGAGDRTLGKLLQRGGFRPADRSAVEALHLAGAPSPRLCAVRFLPSDVSLRVDLGLRDLPDAGRMATPEAPRASGRLVLCLHRSLLDRPLRDRGAPPRPLLALLSPQSPPLC